MRRALMGCDGAAVESRRAMVPAAQNGEPDGRSGNRV